MKHGASKLSTWIVLGALPLAVASVAHAKLPPPTPEEVAAAEQKRAQEEAQLKQAQDQLTRVQDETAAKYKRTRSASGAPAPGAAQAAGETPKEDLPRAARELPRDAGPHGRDEPGAESHSAPAGSPKGATR
jgi:hypothetical protein